MNKRHEKNLLKLADYLDILPRGYKHFDMEGYCKFYDRNHYNQANPHQAKSVINQCGTVACAIGHGPIAGIRVKRDEGWGSYSERQFGLEEFSRSWQWCFACKWTNVPRQNTPKAAAKRIRRLVKNGLTDQMISYMGRCFR